MFVETLLALFAEQAFANAFLQQAPGTLPVVRLPDGQHVSLVVFEGPVKELRHDLRVAQRTTVRTAKSAYWKLC